ncbi:MAG: hypothetical protein WCP09_03880 [Candidatus Taylorbacteria bacterium]
MNFQSGVLDKTRLVSNLLMLLLVAGNIFFSIQYTEGIKQKVTEDSMVAAKNAVRNQAATFMKEFVDIVINPEGTISMDDRVKLENDVRQIHDPAILKQWTAFLNSKDAAAGQTNAIRLMSMVTNVML